MRSFYFENMKIIWILLIFFILKQKRVRRHYWTTHREMAQFYLFYNINGLTVNPHGLLWMKCHYKWNEKWWWIKNEIKYFRCVWHSNISFKFIFDIRSQVHIHYFSNWPFNGWYIYSHVPFPLLLFIGHTNRFDIKNQMNLKQSSFGLFFLGTFCYV